MQIRQARPSDIESLARLHMQSWRTAYRGIFSDAYLDGDLMADRLKLWNGRFDNPAANQYVVVAEHEQAVAGMACVFGDHEAQWGHLLENLHVSPQLKGTGIGRELVAHVAAWCARTHRSPSLHLWVLEGNRAAQGFYQRLGARAVEQAVWDAPDGNPVLELRYAWADMGQLLRQPAPVNTNGVQP